MIPDDKQIEEASKLFSLSFGYAKQADTHPAISFRHGVEWMRQQIMEGASVGWSEYERRIEHLEGYIYIAKEAWQAATLGAEARHREALRVKDAEIKHLKQQFLYVESGDVHLGDMTIVIRREFGMSVGEKHIPKEDKAKEMSK